MIDLGKRKAVTQSQSLFINLPALWVKNNNVKDKDSLNLFWLEDGSLAVRCEK